MALFVRFVITIILILIVFLHIFKIVSIDITDVVVFGIIVLLWFGSNFSRYFDSIELGDAKFTFAKQLNDIREQIDKVDLKAEPKPDDSKPSYLQIADQDPTLALAGLRIEIEKELRTIISGQGITSSRGMPLTIYEMIPQLSKVGIISREQGRVLEKLVRLLNQVVHGAEVSKEDAMWAFDEGPQIIAALKEKHSAFGDEKSTH
ncbi:MAG: hypothetical protein GC204_16015 [Chloroflexi bacterium]|nr:hypothetical protein [Chloroflexota bacterium]